MIPVEAWAADTWSLIVYVLAVFGLIGLMLGLSYLLGGRAWGRAKNEPFESGVVGVGSAQIRISAKFYQVAMFFVIFDLEAVFLFAWSISVRESGWPGFVEALIFVFVLLASLIYLWKIGALDWAPQSRTNTPPHPRTARRALRAAKSSQPQ